MTNGTFKRIVCLANSRKYSGRCIAGKELLADGRPGRWICPVSARENEEVSEHERQYHDGSDPRLLDVMDVPLLNALPKDYQQENWLLDPASYWEKVRRIGRQELAEFTDPVELLWTNGYSTFNGLNDEIPLSIALTLRESLRLISVSNLTLWVFAPGEAFGNSKRRVQERNVIVSGTQYPVFTIGHSNHPKEEFIKLLLHHRVDEVVDVRSSPYSRYTPHFNHDVLSGAVEQIGIGYVFLGHKLGGRPSDRSCYDTDGRVRYDRVAETDLFDDGIRYVIRCADERRIALMCTEKEPLECHRTLLVAKKLWESSVDIEHILADGSLENHAAAMDRLMDIFQLPHNGDMFRSRVDVITDALVRQAKKVAYVGEPLPVGGDDMEHTF